MILMILMKTLMIYWTVRMGSSAALVFADSLQRNNTLLRLHLDHNPLGEKGGRRLLIALEKNTTLEKVSLLGAQLNQVRRCRLTPG